MVWIGNEKKNQAWNFQEHQNLRKKKGNGEKKNVRGQSWNERGEFTTKIKLSFQENVMRKFEGRETNQQSKM